MTVDNRLRKMMTLHKGPLKKDLTRRMFVFDPTCVDKLSTKLISSTLIYMSGYRDGIIKDMVEPINEVEMKEHLYDIAFKYVVDNIED